MNPRFTVVADRFCSAVDNSLRRLLYSPADPRQPVEVRLDLAGRMVVPMDILRIMTGKPQASGVTIELDGDGLDDVCFNLGQVLFWRDDVHSDFDLILRLKYEERAWLEYCQLVAREGNSAAGETIMEKFRAIAMVDLTLALVAKLLQTDVGRTFNLGHAAGEKGTLFASIAGLGGEQGALMGHLTSWGQLLDAYYDIEPGPSLTQIMDYMRLLD